MPSNMQDLRSGTPLENEIFRTELAQIADPEVVWGSLEFCTFQSQYVVRQPPSEGSHEPPVSLITHAAPQSVIIMCS